MDLFPAFQNAISAATPWLASAAVVFALMALGAHIVERGSRCEAIAQFKRLGLLWQVFIVLSVGSATRWAGAKGDRGAPTQPSAPSQAIEPSIAPVAVYTNGVNALSIFGTNILSATVWNVDGVPVTNGVAIVDLLCTNGVLRTPATFEIRWRNTSGLDSVTDNDGDGLTDWEEVFFWNTYPNIADTDGDGLTDGGEVGGGTNPLDADENGDGLPDGLSADAWGANTLWATNAPDGSGTVTITLNEPIPTGTSATLVVGSLCIPLRSPGSWNLGLNPGQIYQYRLVVGGNGGADLSIGPATPPLRGPMNEMSIALWLDGMGFSFNGWSAGGYGTMVIPAVITSWDDPGDGSHVGPTDDDTDLDIVERVPGLVYDYIGVRRRIYAGHPINAPARIYQTLGIGRRPTP